MENDGKYPFQQCQDYDINKAFRELHEKLVNEVISFCGLYGLDVDEFCLQADNISESTKYGSWQPCTDSLFRLDNGNGEPFILSC